MSKRKSPRDAGMPREIDSAVKRCHTWLNDNALPPKIVDSLSAEQRAIVLKMCRSDPRLLIALGAAEDEHPESRPGLVRALLAELLVAKQVDELHDLRTAALNAGRPEAFLFDDARTQRAIPLLERGLQGLALLKEETESRRIALSRVGCELGDRLASIGLLHHVESVLRVVLTQSRSAMGADPPRGLAELKKFRTWWSRRLALAGFTYGEIGALLGYELAPDPASRMRLRDAVRKNCSRSNPPARSSKRTAPRSTA